MAIPIQQKKKIVRKEEEISDELLTLWEEYLRYGLPSEKDAENLWVLVPKLRTKVWETFVSRRVENDFLFDLLRHLDKYSDKELRCTIGERMLNNHPSIDDLRRVLIWVLELEDVVWRVVQALNPLPDDIMQLIYNLHGDNKLAAQIYILEHREASPYDLSYLAKTATGVSHSAIAKILEYTPDEAVKYHHLKSVLEYATPSQKLVIQNLMRQKRTREDIYNELLEEGRR